MTTRDKKEAFIRSFDARTVDDAIRSVIRTHGLDMFEDCIIDEIVADLVDTARSRTKRNRENRQCMAQGAILS